MQIFAPDGVDFLKHLLVTNCTISRITKDPDLFYYFNSFGQQISENLDACRRAVIETNPTNQVFVVHRGFYQRQVLPVRYRFGDLHIPMGDLRKGQVLEIFRWDKNCDITENIIMRLRNDFAATLQRPFPFDQLPNVMFDQYYYFCYKTGVHYVGSPTFQSKNVEKFNPINWTGFSMRAHLYSLYTSIKSTKR